MLQPLLARRATTVLRQSHFQPATRFPKSVGGLGEANVVGETELDACHLRRHCGAWNGITAAWGAASAFGDLVFDQERVEIWLHALVIVRALRACAWFLQEICLAGWRVCL